MRLVGAEQLRQLNTARVLRSLRHEGPASRTELAGRTGLAKATVGTIVGELAVAGTVDEGELATNGRGRPSRPVRLREGSVVGLGLEVNVDYVAAVLVDLAGGVLLSRTDRVPAEQRPIDTAHDLAADVLRSTHGRVAGTCLAIPGLVERDGRTVAWAPNLGWEHERPGEAFADLGLDVTVDNDANLAAVAESAHGAARGVRHALYLTGTVGIGAGIVEDGRLVRGGGGFAGEVGHMPIGLPGRRCGCGRDGCWEATVGLRTMLASVGEPDHVDPLSDAQAVAARARTDASVRDVLFDLGEQLGHGLATLASVLDPGVIVLGGYFVPLGEWLLPPATAVLDTRLPSADRHRPGVRLSALGITAAATGAAEQAVAGVLEGSVAV